MIDINELRALTQAVSGWSNCNHAWLDTSEDVAAAVVGHIDESGETYPVATIDCDQYYAAHQSLPLAKFYAAANPAAISELLDRLEAAEKERDALRSALQHEADCVEAAKAEIDALRAKIEQMERQEPVAAQHRFRHPQKTMPNWSTWQPCAISNRPAWEIDWQGYEVEYRPLYALPGAKGESE